MNDNWRITAKSVTKYDPRYRDENGYYNKNEWVSFYQIGQLFDDGLLSLDSYLSIEEKYIKAAICFFQFHNCNKVSLNNLEKYDSSNYEYSDKEDLLKYYETAIEGTIISINDLSFFIKLVLRELLWAEFFDEKSQDVALRFGYDFYMYFNSNSNMEHLFDEVRTLGLFVD